MSGFPGDVTFLGFPPRKAGKRREFFETLAPEPRVLILYESPQRLAGTLGEMAQYFSDRQVLVVRELTKVFEEAWRGPVAEIAARVAEREIKGECALVLSCPERPGEVEVDVAASLLQTAAATGLSGRRLTDEVAARLNLPRRRVYQTYLELKNQQRLP
jgi:16S rRNA (cytidine1402-2'-O)-methyltransferase